MTPEAEAAHREPDFPPRVVIGANGAYWRDYDDHYSMPIVSEDNDPVEVVAVYVRAERLDDCEEALTGAEREAAHRNSPPEPCSCDWPGCQGQCHTGETCPCHPIASRDDEVATSDRG